MRLIDEIMNYNGQLKDFKELNEKVIQLNEEANARICQATNLPPLLVFQKEKEHLNALPSEKVGSFYHLSYTTLKVATDSTFTYGGNKYSAPPELIGKQVKVQIIEENLYVYYNMNLVVVHTKSKKPVNYIPEHYEALTKLTFPGKEQGEITKRSKQNLEQLEVYNEQLQTVRG